MLDQTRLVHEVLHLRSDISITPEADALALQWYFVPQLDGLTVDEDTEAILEWQGYTWLGQANNRMVSRGNNHERSENQSVTGSP
jgi:hypothetical protein